MCRVTNNHRPAVTRLHVIRKYSSVEVTLMQLRPDQTQRFYHIWFPLLHYVNEQRQLTTTFPDTPEEGSITQNDALQLRDAL
jgi:hypothetical protein